MIRSLAQRPTRLLIGAAALAFVVVLCLAVVAVTRFGERSATVGTQQPAAPALGRGARAPAFTLPRLGGGAAVTLASFAGRPLVLNFFASWCPDCTSELRAFGTAWRQLQGRVSFLAIDTNDADPATARRLLAAAGDGYPAAEDTDAGVAQQYLVSGLPMTVYLDRGGRVLVQVVLGAESAAQVEHWAAVAAAG